SRAASATTEARAATGDRANRHKSHAAAAQVNARPAEPRSVASATGALTRGAKARITSVRNDWTSEWNEDAAPMPASPSASAVPTMVRRSRLTSRARIRSMLWLTSAANPNEATRRYFSGYLKNRNGGKDKRGATGPQRPSARREPPPK